MKKTVCMLLGLCMVLTWGSSAMAQGVDMILFANQEPPKPNMLLGGGATVLSLNGENITSKQLIVARPNSQQVTLFKQAHSDVIVQDIGTKNNSDNIITSLITGDGMAYDIMQTNDAEMLERLIDKGYALDLSTSNTIQDEMLQMHPAIQRICTRGGKIYAIPASINAPAYCINSNVLGNMPFNIEDIPTNLIDLLAFMAMYPNENMLEGGQENCFAILQSLYVAYYEYTGDKLSFDTPLYRDLLTAFEAVDWSTYENDMSYENDDEGNGALIYETYTPLEDGVNRIPLSLSVDTPYISVADMTFTFINSHSQLSELAMEYLEYQFDLYDAASIVPIYPERNELIESPHYEGTMTYFTQRLRQIKQSFKTCSPDEARDIENEINALNEILDNSEDYRYVIHPKVIADYRKLITDNLVLNCSQTFSSRSEEIGSLRNRYLSGFLSAENYISTLTRITDMIEREYR